MLNVRTTLLLISFCIIGWFFLTYKILDVPPGINGDEAAIGYNAALVARTGHDQSGKYLPLFVSTLDFTDWKQPITFYITVLAFKMFGPSYFMLRAVSVVIILISALTIFLLTKEIIDDKAAILSLFIFLTIPSVLIQSHLALENIAPVPFIAMWLWGLVKYEKEKKIKYLFVSATMLGVGLFSYPGMRLIIPVMFVLSMGFIYFIGRNKDRNLVKKLGLFLLGFLPFPLIMFFSRDLYPGAILAYNRPQTIASYQEFFLTYLSSFDWSFLFLKGDATAYHSTGRQGVFLLATLPPFIAGLIRIIKAKQFNFFLIFLAFFLVPALYGLTGSGSIYRSSRMLAIIPAFTVISTMGLMVFLRQKRKKQILGWIIVGLIILNFFDFLRDYWYQYPLRVSNDFSKPMHLVFEKAANLSKKEDLKPYIKDDFSYSNEIATKFFEEVYFPAGIGKLKTPEELPSKSLFITPTINLSNQTTLQRYDTGSGFSIFVRQ